MGRILELRLAEKSGRSRSGDPLAQQTLCVRGYGPNHEISIDESHTTFIALADEGIVDPMTLAEDAFSGLAVDAVLKDEVDRCRAAPGAHVCDLIRFSFERRFLINRVGCPLHNRIPFRPTELSPRRYLNRGGSCGTSPGNAAHLAASVRAFRRRSCPRRFFNLLFT